MVKNKIRLSMFLLAAILLVSCSQRINNIIPSNTQTKFALQTSTNTKPPSNTIIAGILRQTILDTDLKMVIRFGDNNKGLFPLSLSSDECYIWAMLYDSQISGIGIVKTDWIGNQKGSIKWIPQEKLKYFTPNFVFAVTGVSPNGNWLTNNYFESTDIFKHDLFIRSLKEIDFSEPKKISQNGNAVISGPSWAMDESFFVFTDFDEQNIVQLYLFDLKSNKLTQLTKFDSFFEGQEVKDIELAPDMDKIAFISDDYLILTNIASKEIYIHELENGNFSLSNGIYWNNQSSILFTMGTILTNNEYQNQLMWFDSNLNSIDNKIIENTTLDYAIPLDSNLDIIGGWSLKEAGIYNRKLDQWDPKDLFEFTFKDYLTLLVPKNGPIDVSNCH